MSGQGRTILLLGGVLALGIGAVAFLLLSDDGATGPDETTSEDAVAPVTDPAAAPDRTASAGPRRGAKAGTASVLGEIRRSKGKVPVADQEVELIPERGPSWTVRTDARGAFQLSEIPHGGPYELRAAAPKCGTVRIPGIALDRNEKRDVGTLWLDPAVSVTVEVKTWAAAPAEGALVEAFVIAQADNYDWTKAYAQMGQAPVAVAKATTDAAGVAVFPELATGRWSFVATKEGFARSGRTSVSVRSDVPTPPVKLFLGVGHPLCGRVTDSAKQPVAGALVLAGGGSGGWDLGASALRSRATTDPDGRYAFAALDAGDTVLLVGRPGGIPSQVAVLRIPNVSEFDVVLKGTATVTGVVTSKDGGKPIDGATVRAWNWSGGGSNVAEATSDAEGKFAVVVTEGTVGSFTAEKAGWVTAEDRTRQRPPLQIREGETQTRDLVLKPGSKVEGVVSGPEGPIPGAKVWVHYGGPNTGYQQKMGMSDADGKYEVLAVTPGKAFVRAEYAGHYVKDLPDNFWMVLQQPGPSPFKIDVPEGGTATKDLEMAKGGSVEGRVEGPDGPLAGVRIASPLDWEGGVVTGADGAFRVEGVKPGPNVSLYPTLDGYAPSPANKPFAVTADQPTTGIVLRIVRVGTVRGVVTVADGSPLAEARVSVAAWQDQQDPNMFFGGWNPSQQGVKYPVRPDGSYEIPLGGISTGKFRVHLTALERPAAQSEVIPIVDGQSDYVVNLSVDGGRDLTGRVTVKQGGAPVAGAQVALRARPSGGRGVPVQWDGNMGGGGQVVWAISDAEGKFAVAHLAPATYSVTATCPGFVNGSASVDLATASNVTIELDQELSIEGTVAYGDGVAIEGAQLSATREDPSAAGPKVNTMDGMPAPGGSAWATSGSGGRFRLTGLVAGNYRIRVQQDWQGEINIKTKVTDPIAAGTLGVKIAVDSGGVISGRVLDPQKKPAGNVQLNANPEAKDGRRPEGAESRGARTRDDGTFSIGGLSENVTYMLSVQASMDWGGMGGSTWKNVTLNGVTPGTTNLEIVLEEGLTITGTIMDAEGRPVANSMLTCTVKGGDGRPGRQNRQVMADAQGAFTFGGLEPGEASIALQEWGAGQGLVIQNGDRVAVGSRDVQLVASKGLTITGSLTDEAGQALKNVSVSANPKGGGRGRSARVTESGSFEITGLAAGAVYTVMAHVPNRPLARADDVAAGSNGVRLVSPKGLEASGRLLDAAGDPLKNTMLIATLVGDNMQRQQTTSDGEGKFKLAGLLDAPYELTCYVQTARAGGGMTSSSKKCGTLKGGDEGVELRAAADGK